jgi:CRP-like cAMP-binding protein
MTNNIFLKKIELFSGLNGKDINRFLAISIEKNYRKGDVIFHHNDEGSSLFILKSGMVKVSIFDRNGREDILKIVHPYDCFGEMSLLDGYHRSATVTAMERSDALIIRREDFIALIKKHPDVALTMLALLCRRLRKTDEKIASLRFADSYGKVARVLLDISYEKGIKKGGGIVFDLNINRDTLANLAGVSRETATRILREFQDRGCIKISGRKVSILDESVLKREVL